MIRLIVSVKKLEVIGEKIMVNEWMGVRDQGLGVRDWGVQIADFRI